MDEMHRIKYISGDSTQLDRIQNLWLELNRHHASVSTHFSDDFLKLTFDARKNSLIQKSKKGHMLVDTVIMVVDCDTKTDIGYCVSIVNSDNVGEIESIYIEPNFRNSGIGQELIRRAIQWMEAHHVTEKKVVVAYGNEQAFKFYSKFGFLPRITVLKQSSE